ncbi:MAG TPA: sugar ABC transporter permease, partial [Tepidisphaeraceae bacterium]|nr:sugar ABC transporter permease [Tepidisphaeraceae bacterium]
DIINPAQFVGLENYREMLTQDPLIWKSLGNVLYMVLGLPLGMILSLAIALLLNQGTRWLAGWRTLFYLPSIVPAVAAALLWAWLLNPNAGLVNYVLQYPINWINFIWHGQFGFDALQRPGWLQSETWSKPSLIVMSMWGAGGGMIIWLAGLKGIPQSYYEAAAVDGASPLRQFWHITLPQLTPYIFFNLVMGLIGTFQLFESSFILTGGGPADTTLFYVYHLFNNAFRYGNMGYASAMAWMLFVIILGITIFQLRMSKRWVHYEED